MSYLNTQLRHVENIIKENTDGYEIITTECMSMPNDSYIMLIEDESPYLRSQELDGSISIIGVRLQFDLFKIYKDNLEEVKEDVWTTIEDLNCDKHISFQDLLYFKDDCNGNTGYAASGIITTTNR